MAKLLITKKVTRVLRVGGLKSELPGEVAPVEAKAPVVPADGFCKCEKKPADDTLCPSCGKPGEPDAEAEEAEEPKSAAVITGKGEAELVGKAVFFASGGHRVAGKVKLAANGELVVQLAVPGNDGILRVSETEIVVKAGDAEVVDAITKQTRMKTFEAGAALTVNTDSKAVTILDEDEKTVCDYQNVTISGYASTFVSKTKKDRGGDYILPGAFDRTIPEFMKNPVILCNHTNTVEAIAGSWAKVNTNLQGLTVVGNITNAPGLRDVRFKLMEGHLKGVSIGGIWYYLDDGYGIEDADLFEISLVAVPMNPDALVRTSSLGEADCVKAFSKYWRSHTGLRDS